MKDIQSMFQDLKMAERRNLIKTTYRRVYQHVTPDLEPIPYTTEQLYIEHHAHTPVHIQNKLEQFFKRNGFQTRNYDDQHTLKVWVE